MGGEAKSGDKLHPIRESIEKLQKRKKDIKALKRATISSHHLINYIQKRIAYDSCSN